MVKRNIESEVGVGDTLSDSIQCLNFAEKMIQFISQFNIAYPKFNPNYY